MRDILHIDDAVAAYRSVLDNIGSVSGRAFNLGGGPHNAVSLKLVLHEAQRIVGRDLAISYEEWRPGDQLYFVADTRKLENELGWKPRIAWRDGLKSLALWLVSERLSAPQVQKELQRSAK